MNRTETRTNKFLGIADSTLSVTFGCLLIALSSCIKIPFYPVSMTLHTAIIFFLALTQSPNRALGSALLYLLAGTVGLPVFCGASNPLWMTGICAGYYISFPFAAFFISKMNQKFSPITSIFCGQLIIYTLGFSWLSSFVGAKTAFTHGVLFFIPSAILKSIVVAYLSSKWKVYLEK